MDIHFAWDYHNTKLGIIINNNDMDIPVHMYWNTWA